MKQTKYPEADYPAAVRLFYAMLEEKWVSWHVKKWEQLHDDAKETFIRMAKTVINP
jgi:hypothetical protein